MPGRRWSNAPQARTATLALIIFNDFALPEPGAGMAAGVLATLPMILLFFHHHAHLHRRFDCGRGERMINHEWRIIESYLLSALHS